MSVGNCPCDTREQHPVSECIVPGQTNDEAFADDVRALVVALGLGDHARPYSAHAVIHREVLPALRALPLPECPTHAVCPNCRVGWGHWNGKRYEPTAQSRTANEPTTEEPPMTAPSPAGLSPLLDQLDEARAAATPGPWVQDIYEILAPRHRLVVETGWRPDAALIVAVVNALPDLLAEVRRGRALREAVDGLHTKGAHGMCAGCGWTFPCPTVAALTAALTPGADTAGATA